MFMRRKMIITVILVLALVLTMIPFGALYAVDADKVLDGDFSLDTVDQGPKSTYWTKDNAYVDDNYLVVVSGGNDGNAVELKESGADYAKITSKTKIPITTKNQTFSVEIKPTTFETGGAPYIGIWVEFFNGASSVKTIETKYYSGDFTIDQWKTVSINLADCTESADSILVGAYVHVGSTPGQIITARVDNFKLTSNPAGSSGSSSASRSLTPDEWIAQNHNIDDLQNQYGATPKGFLGMLYDNSMQRIPDESGLIYWNEKLNLQIFGANFVAEHFLFSDEIGAKVAAMTNEDYVNYLYTTLLSRNSDTDGYNNWLSYLNSGFSKEETLRAFLNNEEWINICKLFNVTP